MHALPGFVETLAVLTNFALLGSTRVGACCRWLALQGLLIGAMPLFLDGGEHETRVWLLALGNIAVKGIAFPWMLLRLRARTGFKREVEPFVGFTGSIVFGFAALALATWLGRRVNAVMIDESFAVLHAALFLIFVGVFLIVSRRKALMQVLGFVVLENGIFVFGLTTVAHTPLLVELGVMLDAFVGVFVMGIAVFHINREFSDMDVGVLRSLRD